MRHRRGLAHATAGNISARLPDGNGHPIAPTDACLGRMRPEDLAHVDASGTQRSGAPASKALALHQQIYAAAPEAQCVIHTHSSHLVGLALAAPGLGVWRADTVLPPITPCFVMKVGRVPLIPYHRPGDPAVGPPVAQQIHQAREQAAPIRAVLLERLGPNVWHDSPAAAMATLDELEETAKLWLMTLPRAKPLDAAQIDVLRQTFGVSWPNPWPPNT